MPTHLSRSTRLVARPSAPPYPALPHPTPPHPTASRTRRRLREV